MGFTFAISAAILSCNNRGNAKNRNHYKNFGLGITSPYGCYNEVTIDSTGLGTTILKGDSAKDIWKKKNFFIGSEQDSLKIVGLINRVERSPSVTSSAGLDLYHFSVFVDNKMYIYTYKQDSLVMDILHTLLPYAHLGYSGGQCDFFDLLKKDSVK